MLKHFVFWQDNLPTGFPLTHLASFRKCNLAGGVLGASSNPKHQQNPKQTNNSV